MILASTVSSWVENAVGSVVTAATPYDGASTASVYRVEMESGRTLVLKRYDVDDPYDRRADRCAHEAAVLDWLAGGSVPVPGVVDHDPDGSMTGAPSLLMEHVTGSNVLPQRWQKPLAALVVAIHETDPGPIKWAFEPYWATIDLAIPDWAGDVGVWRGAFAVLREDPPETSFGLIHRDLHPGNVLWCDGEISGLIDWMQACIGPQGLDVAHCRANLVMDHGFLAADQFLTAYQNTATESQWHPYWDLVDAVDFVPYLLGDEAVREWRWDDRPAVSVRARFESYLRNALVALDQIG